ncbi:glycosyltransferase family 2 protein [Costertonia aggregata]|uniref:Glycosyltransferase family 2 protein n=1 Tax=Costertonia aggregata TaxID=343403 RepID=A0A7H9ASB4_9FLAO|nr:glycosyltransferase family 2 protein [Costertonia aggregata]QLG46326.1 glycosyltransferase family 2 protein [Costertonia aggregata]
MSLSKKNISIITINYNSSEYTKNCIDSIIQVCTNTLEFEIIVVDNASEIQDYRNIEEHIKTLNNNKIKLMRSRINIGFGAGNMYGVQQANADYYLILNNDCIFKEDVLSYCYMFMQEHTNVACCGPRSVDQDGNQWHGFNHFTSFTKEIIGKKAAEFLKGPSTPRLRKKYTNPIKVDYVNGSFMFFRSSFFDMVGGFDTNLFLYYEESDICQRLSKMGKCTYYLPNITYVHYKDKSIGESLAATTKLIEYNTSLFYVMRKHHTWLYFKIFHFFFSLRYFIKSFAKPKYFPIFLKAVGGFPLHKSLKQKQVLTSPV